MKKLAHEAKPVKKEKDPNKAAKEKEEKLKKQLQDIDEKFFDHVADEQYDIEAIKARGAITHEAEIPGKPGVKIEQVELQPGKTYEFACPNGTFIFQAETGGIIAGDNINGSVQAGKVIFTAGKDEYEGFFDSPA